MFNLQIMGAGPPLENKNAEKYDEKAAIKLFNDSIKLALTEEEGAYTYDFIGEVARKLKIYHDLYIHLCNRFNSVKPLYTELKQILEANCYSNTKKGKIREATGIVNLKSNHHWTDRQQVDTTISGDLNVNPKKWIKKDESD